MKSFTLCTSVIVGVAVFSMCTVYAQEGASNLAILAQRYDKEKKNYEKSKRGCCVCLSDVDHVLYNRDSAQKHYYAAVKENNQNQVVAWPEVPEGCKREVLSMTNQNLSVLSFDQSPNSRDLALLTEIDISHNHVQDLTSILDVCSKLKKLNASYNNVSYIPLHVKAASSLEELDLSYNELKEVSLSDFFKKYTEIQSLNLSHNTKLACVTWDDYFYFGRDSIVKDDLFIDLCGTDLTGEQKRHLYSKFTSELQVPTKNVASLFGVIVGEVSAIGGVASVWAAINPFCNPGCELLPGLVGVGASLVAFPVMGILGGLLTYQGVKYCCLREQLVQIQERASQQLLIDYVSDDQDDGVFELQRLLDERV